jgi:hypothetical protein
MGNHIVTKTPDFQHNTNTSCFKHLTNRLFKAGMRRTTPLPGSVGMKFGVITELENNTQHPKSFWTI